MDGFERQLEQDLARFLDPIVETPAPPRSGGWRDGHRGRLRIFQGGLPEVGMASLEMPEVVPVVVPVAVTAHTNLP